MSPSVCRRKYLVPEKETQHELNKLDWQVDVQLVGEGKGTGRSFQSVGAGSICDWGSVMNSTVDG